MTNDLAVLENIIASILLGTYGVVPDDIYVLGCCENLREEAEIFTALHPDKAAVYLKEHKTALYQVMTRLRDQMLKVDEGKRLQLEFVEVGVVKLYKVYLELIAEVET